MEKRKIICLREHHLYNLAYLLICPVLFSELAKKRIWENEKYGKSKKTKERFYNHALKILNIILTQDVLVKIVSCEDDICRKCPNRKAWACEMPDDDIAYEKFDLGASDLYTSEEVIKKLKVFYKENKYRFEDGE